MPRSVAWPFSCVSQCRNGTYSVVTSMNRGPGLGQPAGEQAAQAEAARVVVVEDFLRLLRQVEGFALVAS